MSTGGIKDKDDPMELIDKMYLVRYSMNQRLRQKIWKSTMTNTMI